MPTAALSPHPVQDLALDASLGEDFSLPDILDCGQCFRFRPVEQSRYPQCYEGVAFGRYLRLSRKADGTVILHDTTPQELEQIWGPYFDLDTDYRGVKGILSQDPVLAKAAAYAPGIRVLRQEGWEALCCFIFSQNNNIRRIQGIVERFCAAFGRPLEGAPGWYAFPTPEELRGITPEDLAPLRAGFRAKYLADAVEKVASGQVRLELLSQLPLPQAREELQQIHGVGPKVAECALLYGFGRMECFPLDVWMKRVMERLFPQGLPQFALPWAGIAQQYLFHYARTCPGALE